MGAGSGRRGQPGIFGPLLTPGPRRIAADEGFGARDVLRDERAILGLQLPGRMLLFRLRFGLYAVRSRLQAGRGSPHAGTLDRKGQRRGDDRESSGCYPPPIMSDGEIPHEYQGWWRILETSQWVNDDIDICGTALLSLTGRGDRLRMFVLLATVDCKATKTGVSFTWAGAWEFDQVTGTGSVKLGKDGRLKGKFRIKNGDDSTFIAERAEAPREPIPNPPSYRDKWRRRW